MFDADKAVHDLYEKGGAGINIYKIFLPSRRLLTVPVNREILRSYIVENPDKIRELESSYPPFGKKVA